MTGFYIATLGEGSQMTAVFRNGKQVSPASRDPEYTKARLSEQERLAVPKGADLRDCLGCGKAFPSDGVHNRLCGCCSRNAIDRQMGEPCTPHR